MLLLDGARQYEALVLAHALLHAELDNISLTGPGSDCHCLLFLWPASSRRSLQAPSGRRHAPNPHSDRLPVFPFSTPHYLLSNRERPEKLTAKLKSSLICLDALLLRLRLTSTVLRSPPIVDYPELRRTMAASSMGSAKGPGMLIEFILPSCVRYHLGGLAY